ncbi:MAG TPA: FN3 domain-containing metallophosphoesterase family protein [Bacteroidales bacterium]|nr:FN3 domain-containing metallophosphoesterase family protein [Bacteroidales bacterium]
MRKITFIALLFFAAVTGSKAQVQESFGFRCEPYLQNLTEHSISVMWLMNKDCSSWVEYGQTAELGSKAYHAEGGLIDAGKRIQKIGLQKLESGKKYYYRTASREILVFKPYQVIYGDTVYSPVHSFTTPSANQETFSFLVFNDLHNKPQYLKEVVANEKDFDFVVLNGDIVVDIDSIGMIVNTFLNNCSQYFATDKPFLMVRGNHETRGRYARILKDFIDTGSDEFYYTYQYGNASFIILDTGEDKVDENKEYFGLADFSRYRSTEADWLQAVVKSRNFTKAKYKLVLAHIPTTLGQGGEKAGGEADCSNKFAPILNKSKIDLMLSGHVHHYSIVLPKKGVDNYPVMIGGSPINQKRVAYIRVNISKDKQEALLKNLDGSILGKYVFKK